MQVEIKIVLFNPTTDPNNFAADVYVDGNRQFCGKGGKNAADALQEATDWINQFDAINWKPA
jgi:hypothetical protein